jgi:adhesin transport system membrane fusion protein
MAKEMKFFKNLNKQNVISFCRAIFSKDIFGKDVFSKDIFGRAAGFCRAFFGKEFFGKLSGALQTSRLKNIKHQIEQISATDLSFYLITGLFTIMILWAFIFKIDKSINVTGELSPKGRPVIIQNRFEGKVSEIIVEAGKKVQKGDVLVKFETLTDVSSLTENIAENEKAALEMRRLKSQMTFSDQMEKLPGDNQMIFEDQQRLLTSEVGKLRADKEILNKEFELKKIQLENMDNKIANLVENKNLVMSKFTVMQKLYEKGYEGEIAFLEEKQNLSDVQTKILEVKYEREQIALELELIEQKLNALIMEFEKSTSQQLSEAQRIFDLTTIRQNSLDAKINEYTIVAPLDGTISKLLLENPGTVISAGTVLYELIPEGVEIVFYAQIPVASVNELQIGQKANVTLATMDARSEKPIDSQVSYIEEDATEDENGLKFYNAFLSFVDYREQNLIPGVNGTAAILMGKRTVIEYFMEPIFDSMSGALSER